MIRMLLIIFFVFCMSSLIFAQKHTLGFTLNVTYNHNYLGKNFSIDENSFRPFRINHKLGIEYNYNLPNNGFSLYTAIMEIPHNVCASRKFDRLINGNSVEVAPRRCTGGSSIGLGLGVRWDINSIQITSGFSFRNINERPRGSIGAVVFENHAYSGINELEYLLSFPLHTSIFLKVNIDLKIFRNKYERLGLNIISNIGLHPIYIAKSRYDNFTTGEVIHTELNNFGTYFGLGLTYSRSSNCKFTTIFKSNKK